MTNPNMSNGADHHLDFPDRLRGYQREGVTFLLERDSALLSDEMGLGKTVQVVVAVRLLLLSGNADRVLVVVPRVLRSNWEHEFSLWAPELLVRRVDGNKQNRASFYFLPLPVVIATYEQILHDSAELDECSEFDVVVLDEAQRIKDVASRTSISCRGIPRKRSWALTGTPVENTPDDIISLFAFVRRGLLARGGPVGEIQERIIPYFLRRTKDEVLPGLPPIIVQDLELEIQGRQRSAYLDVWEHRTETLRNASYVHILGLITRLKQLCNFDPVSGESVKFEALEFLLQNLSEPSDKVIVFSQYVKTLRWISGQLETFSHRLFHGGQDDDERERTLDWFRTVRKPSALLMSIKAGGVGLNLQAAATVVLFDRWWNPAVEQQAIHRAHRLGRTRPLHVVRFLVTDTIEERIARILRGKSHLFETYVEQAESAKVAPLSRNELRAILKLPAEAVSKDFESPHLE